MAQCRSCGAAVRWVKMRDSGIALPLDEKPNTSGNIVVSLDGKGARVLKDGETGGNLPRYTSHFATCPDADQPRKA